MAENSSPAPPQVRKVHSPELVYVLCLRKCRVRGPPPPNAEPLKSAYFHVPMEGSGPVMQAGLFGHECLLTQSGEAFEGDEMKFHLCYREQGCIAGWKEVWRPGVSQGR